MTIYISILFSVLLDVLSRVTEICLRKHDKFARDRTNCDRINREAFYSFRAIILLRDSKFRRPFRRPFVSFRASCTRAIPYVFSLLLEKKKKTSIIGEDHRALAARSRGEGKI